MKVVHRVSFNTKREPRVLRKLNKLGVKPWAIQGKLAVALNMRFFDISEDDPVWPEVSKIIKKNKIPTVPKVEFTREEILCAEWVLLNPLYFEDDGYPEPHLDGTWRNVSFNAGKECPACGIGIEQTGPIHLKGEPKLGKNDFVSIFWTYSTFARFEVFEILQRKDINGFEPIPVVHHSLRTPLKTVKQLRITQVNKACIIDDNLVRDNTTCGHVKYNVLATGMMKFSRDAFSKVPDLMRTHEWFGSGHSAFQLVLASAKFVQIYLECKWRGLYLAPIELV